MYVTATTEKRIGTMNKEIKVGNVLRSAWGYGAINITFYIVTAVSAKGRVKIAMIGKERVKAADIEREMYDTVRPVFYEKEDLIETGYKLVKEDGNGAYIAMNGFERVRKICENAEEAADWTSEETNSWFI